MNAQNHGSDLLRLPLRAHWVALLAMMVAAALIGFAAFASELSPVGLWKTIDDHTGKPRGLVRIMEVNGEYHGKVEKIFIEPGEDPDPKCEKCDGERHNQPVIGMTILWGLKKQGDEYQGGAILDPESGKVYRARMKLDGKGEKLSVRGFIGFALLGRTQIWVRDE